MQRVSKRVGNKVISGYTVHGEFFRTKKEAGLARTTRSDKKCVSDNNVVPVVLKLLLERGTELLDRVAGDTAAEKLVLDTWDSVLDSMFLLFHCAASYSVWTQSEKSTHAVCFKFLYTFYPDAMEDESNKDVQPLRYQRGGYSEDRLDNDGWVQEWVAQHSDGTVLGEVVQRDVSVLRRRTDIEYVPTPSTIKGLLLKSSRAAVVKYSIIAESV